MPSRSELKLPRVQHGKVDTARSIGADHVIDYTLKISPERAALRSDPGAMPIIHLRLQARSKSNGIYVGAGATQVSSDAQDVIGTVAIADWTIRRHAAS